MIFTKKCAIDDLNDNRREELVMKNKFESSEEMTLEQGGHEEAEGRCFKEARAKLRGERAWNRRATKRSIIGTESKRSTAKDVRSPVKI